MEGLSAKSTASKLFGPSASTAPVSWKSKQLKELTHSISNLKLLLTGTKDVLPLLQPLLISRVNFFNAL